MDLHIIQVLDIHLNEVKTDNSFMDITHDTHISGDPHKWGSYGIITYVSIVASVNIRISQLRQYPYEWVAEILLYRPASTEA